MSSDIDLVGIFWFQSQCTRRSSGPPLQLIFVCSPTRRTFFVTTCLHEQQTKANWPNIVWTACNWLSQKLCGRRRGQHRLHHTPTKTNMASGEAQRQIWLAASASSNVKFTESKATHTHKWETFDAKADMFRRVLAFFLFFMHLLDGIFVRKRF